MGDFMERYWKKIPAIRLGVPLLLGFFLSGLFSIALQLLFVLNFGLLLAYFAFSKWSNPLSYPQKLTKGLLIQIICLFNGLLIGQSVLVQQQKYHFSQTADESAYLYFQPLQKWEQQFNRISTIGRVKGQLEAGKYRSSEGRLKVSIYCKGHCDSLQQELNAGHALLLPNVAKAIPKAANISSFDYRQYMQSLGIFHEMTLFPNHSYGVVTANFFLHRWKFSILEVGSKVSEILQEKMSYQPGLAIVNAMLTGSKNWIEKEQKEAFANTGAMHILAVSGLHTGVLFLLLQSLVIFIPPQKWGIFIRISVIVGGLWFYAVMTGLSPSVCRAAGMFSFISIGWNLNRYTTIYGAIVLAFITLFIINPYLLQQVSFQLSFLALTGIVYYQPKIAAFFRIRFAFGQKLVDLMAVSLAAQIATMPISFYYFGQMPAYGLLTNLIAVPAAAFIIYFGLATLLFYAFFALSGIGFLDILSDWSAWILDLITTVLNESIVFVNQNFPYVTYEMPVVQFEVWLFYALIFALSAYLIYQKQKALLYTLFFGLIWLSYNTLHYYQIKDHQSFYFYKHYQYPLVVYVHYPEVYLITNEAGMADQAQIYKKIKPYYTEQLSTQLNFHWVDAQKAAELPNLKVQPPFISANEKLILWADDLGYEVADLAKALGQSKIDYLYYPKASAAFEFAQYDKAGLLNYEQLITSEKIPHFKSPKQVSLEDGGKEILLHSSKVAFSPFSK